MTDEAVERGNTSEDPHAGQVRVPWIPPRVEILPPLADLTLVTLNLDENGFQAEGILGDESIFSSPDS